MDRIHYVGLDVHKKTISYVFAKLTGGWYTSESLRRTEQQ
jgi:hypothetical protein